MGWQKKTKEFFLNHCFTIPTPKSFFHFLTITVLSLLLPLSFLLLAALSGAQYYLQFLTTTSLPFLFSLSLHVIPSILYIMVSIVCIATLIQSLMGKITLISSSSSSSNSILRPRIYIAWLLLCTFQVCVGLGIEGSIAAGVFNNDEADDDDQSFGIVERSFVSRMIFLLGLHETTQVWSRVVVRPVVDDTVFGGGKRERWIERVAVAASLGTLWWWRLRDEVETLAVVAEMKKEQGMEVGIEDFVGWWLYYLTVTIGMVRLVKGVIWMFVVSLCRRRVTAISPMELEPVQSDDKV